MRLIPTTALALVATLVVILAGLAHPAAQAQPQPPGYQYVQEPAGKHVLPFIVANGYMLVVDWGDGSMASRRAEVRVPGDPPQYVPLADWAPDLVAAGWVLLTPDNPWLNPDTGEVYVYAENSNAPPGTTTAATLTVVVPEMVDPDAFVVNCAACTRVCPDPIDQDPPTWLDTTTTNAPAGSPGYGRRDGEVTAADLQFYVNAWVTR